ncbi:DNA polymerase III subunit beta [Terriglobus saanensis]|uniref:Beta sliding clamp n=1 Tax=Terriglobus saanensis (strain ATCC BAA-1853 / DSM 23119 / SP1PR4) TaxID=401053 RepID=E8V6P8_TERSS|nr:DNA polymerase III subunit beta [Terriglobus saanensis]ADV83850.1 DNA polymerase III, beta subunit [Terriglobus saanensis SP1PR4]
MADVKMKTKMLRSAVEIVRPAIAKASVGIPALRTIKMEKMPEGMGISANNLNVGIRVNLLTEFPDDRPVAISAERLLNYVKLLDTEEVSITFKSDKARFSSGACRAQVPTVEGAPEFPMPTEGQTIAMAQDVLLRALRHVAFAMTESENRFVVDGALLTAKDGYLEVAALDGYRISVYRIEMKGLPECEILLPGDLCDALLATLRDCDATVSIQLGESAIGVRMEGIEAQIIEIRAGRLAKKFAPYNKILPENRRLAIVLPAPRLLLAAQRCIAMADIKTQCIRMYFERESITLNGATPDSGDADEAVSIEGGPQTKLAMAFKGEYLVDALKKLRGDVTVDIGEKDQVMMLYAEPFEGETLRYGVMPMRV